jgi:hypothetical protein
MTIRFPRTIAAAFGVAALVGLTAFTSPGNGAKTITVVNKTTFNVDRIFLSPVEEKNWGDDILGETEILKPGDEVEIEIDCGSWDVKLVAEDESTCELAGVEICAADIWEITSDCGE